MSAVEESYIEDIEDPGDLDVVLKDWFKNVEPTSEIWANISGGPVDDEAAAAPDEEAIKNAEVVFEASSSGKRTRQQSTVSLSGEKKRRKTKLNDFGGDTNAHLRHRQMNNLSVKRCREKKKQEYEALMTGYKKQEGDLKKTKTEIGTLKATIKKLQAAGHAPASTNDNANKNLVKSMSSSTTPAIRGRPSVCSQIAEVSSLKAVLQEKDMEIASLKLERDYGLVEVDRLENALRPFKHQELEQTWGGMAGDSEQDSGNKELPVNNEVLFNKVINE